VPFQLQTRFVRAAEGEEIDTLIPTFVSDVLVADDGVGGTNDSTRGRVVVVVEEVVVVVVVEGAPEQVIEQVAPELLSLSVMISQMLSPVLLFAFAWKYRSFVFEHITFENIVLLSELKS
jgi:hypothetical protein